MTGRAAVVGGDRLGDWSLERRLGRGAMGVVWAARHVGTGEVAAVKTAREARPAMLLAIRREIAALRAVDHPGVVRIFDDGVEGDVPWLAMELVEGERLADALATGETSAPTMATTWEGGVADVAAPDRGANPTAEVLVQVCDALAAVHAAGLVHRDLKPDNVLVRPDGRAVLVDFGVFARTESALGREVVEAQPAIAGTPGFMAPEQRAGEPVDGRADLFAVGRMLARVPGAPAAVHALVERLCAPAASDRPARASEVARAIEAAFGLPRSDAAPTREATLLRAPWVGPLAVPAALRAALDRASGGRGGTLAVIGPEGSGRSRALADAARSAARQGLWVLSGRCPQGGRHLAGLEGPLSALVDLAPQIPATDALRDAASVLAAFVPSVGAAFGASPTREALSAARLTASVVELLRAAAATKPTLVVLDDLQWADEATLAVVRAIGPVADACGLVVVVSCWVADALPDDVVRLDLGPLEPGDVGALARASLGPNAVDPALVSALVDGTDRTPLAVRDALHEQLATGALGVADGAWRVAPGAEVRADRIPARRLADLEPGDRALAEAVAVLGADADLVALSRVVDEPEAVVLERLARLTRARVAAEDGGRVRPVSGDLARHLLAGPRSPGLHARAADALADRPRAAFARVRHLVEAGQPERAWPIAMDEAPKLKDRGAVASAVEAWDVAAAHAPPEVAFEASYLAAGALVQLGRYPEALTRAQLAWDRAADDSTRAQARTLEAIALRMLDPVGALPLAEEAVVLAGRSGRPDLQARAAFEHAFALIRAGRPDPAVLRAAIALLEAQEEAPKAANAWSILSHIVSDPADQLDALARSRAWAERSTDRSILAKFAVANAVTLIGLGRADEALAGLREALPVLRAAGERPLEWHGCADLVHWCWGSGRSAEGIASLERAEVLARELRDPSFLARTGAYGARLYADLGWHRHAAAAAEGALDVAVRAGLAGLTRDAWLARGTAHRAAGELDEALACLDAARAVPLRPDESLGAALEAIERAWIALARGESPEAWLDAVAEPPPLLAGQLARLRAACGSAG